MSLSALNPYKIFWRRKTNHFETPTPFLTKSNSREMVGQQRHGEHNKITYQNSIRSNLLNWGEQDSNTYLLLSSEYINDRGVVSGREPKIFGGRIYTRIHES